MYRRVALLATVLIVLTLPLGWRIGAHSGGSAAAGAQRASLVQAIATTVVVEGRPYPVKMVKARLSGVRIKVGLAEGRVGHTESLAGIAQRYAAVAGINGSFFDAYTANPIKSPDNTLITNGVVVHKGNIGSLIGFTADNRARIERLPLKIEGGLDGDFKYPNNWYAYWFNRYPEHANVVTIFTPYWGKSTGLHDGIQAVVSKGRVTRVGTGSQAIPDDGYVVYFRGSEVRQTERFRVGRRCAYRIVVEDGRALGFWAQVQEAVGAGPRLLTDGRVTVDPVAEGFRDPKIVSMSVARSMVGLTKDAWLILATSGGTVRQMAGVMKALGAYQAMNLDSGASSGLWVRGKYLSTPGRLISNALLMEERLSP